MALSPGKRLGPYEIVSLLGEGGMGEVYRARDQRLNRDVAIKVLHESVSSDADRLGRFEQEARAVATLNDPNILSIYDVGCEAGIHYIVMELLDGESLRQRLERGPLPLKRTLEMAVQIAQGLSAAHGKGIVHRDLKPENLFLTKNGHIKILDFGLAKPYLRSASSGDEPTIAGVAQTAAGAIWGTPGYLAPEQIRGEAADPRADIFAFGAVLYEMVAGHRAFQRPSSVETMTAVLNDEPRAIIPTNSAPHARRLEPIIRHCLEKDPEQRFQSAKDLSFALLQTADSVDVPIESAKPRAQKRLWLAAGVGVAILLAVSALIVRALVSGSTTDPLFQQLTFRSGDIGPGGVRFGPDGQTIIYTAAWEHLPYRLYTSRADGTDLRELNLPPGALGAVSHQGDLAVAVGTELGMIGEPHRVSRVALSGGAPRDVLDNVRWTDWSPDGKQLAVTRADHGKARLEFPIGTPLYETNGDASFIRVSPQGDAIAFFDNPVVGDARGSVAVVDLKGQKKVLTQEWVAGIGLAWSPDGTEIWFTASDAHEGRTIDPALYAVTRSGRRRLVLRTPGNIELNDIAPDGRVLLIRRTSSFDVFAGVTGGEFRKISWLPQMLPSAFSGDVQKIVLSDPGATDPEYATYLVPLDGSPGVRLGAGFGGGISQDDKWVATIQPRDMSRVWLLPTGPGEPKVVTAPDFQYRSASFASDARRLLVHASQSNRPVRVWVQQVDGGAPTALTPEGSDGPIIILSGRDYVAARDEEGQSRLYPCDGGDSEPIAGLHASDTVIGGSQEPNMVYITPSQSIPLEIDTLNIRTGVRKVFTTISPIEPAGVFTLFPTAVPPLITREGKKFVYTQGRSLSVLYVATGLR